MAKSSLRQVQKLQQKLSQQNIQLFKMMEMNMLQFIEKVNEELDVNPALDDIEKLDTISFSYLENSNPIKESSLDAIQPTKKDYDQHGLYEGYSNKDEDREFFIPSKDNDTLIASLNDQIQYANLSPDQTIIAEFVIGSIDDDGYLRRNADSIVDDLSFRQNFYTTAREVEDVIEFIHELDPPGIGARSLQECLLIQLKRKKFSKEVDKAHTIITDYFEDYTKKNYEKIQKKLNLSASELDTVKDIIQRLNPTPGVHTEDNLGKYILPDFFVFRNGNKLELELHTYNKPNLVINSEFVEMLKKMKADRKRSNTEQEAYEYVADKVQKANQFISLLKERQETMVIVMNTILDYQYTYFLSGDEADLKPMGLKNIAEICNFDISTISRITSSKYVQTEFGIIALKSLFTEGITAIDGSEISNRKVMKSIEQIIENENKLQPFSDDEIAQKLEQEGYPIARRTVAKYRENLKIPAKHQRKKLQ